MAHTNKTNKNNEGSDQVPSSNTPSNGDSYLGAISPEAVKIFKTNDNSQVAALEKQLTELFLKRKTRKGAQKIIARTTRLRVGSSLSLSNSKGARHDKG